MHCSNCGTLLTQNLNYCQHCGSRNLQSPIVASTPQSNLFVAAGGAIGVIGLIVFFPVLRELLHSSLPPPAVVMILIGYLITVFLMFAVLIGHVWKRSGDFRIKGSERADDQLYAAPAAFRGVNTAQLEPAMDRPGSVTEHTTRTLEDAPFLRK